jgi:RES domain
MSLPFWRATWPGALPLNLAPRACESRRCHVVDDPVPLYGSLDAHTPFAELQRQVDYEDVDLVGMRVRIAKLSFVGMVYDGLTAAGLAEARVSAESLLTDGDYRGSQRLMAHAVARGAHALLLPSVAVEGATSLVIAHAAVPHTVRLESHEVVTLDERHLP